MKRIGSVLALVPLAGLSLLAAAGCSHHGYARYDDPYYQDPRPYYGEPRPQGSRYDRGGGRESLRSLAYELDQSLQYLSQSSLNYGRRDRDDRKLREDIHELMQRNARFQERLSQRNRADLDEDVDEMRDLARKVGERMRDARVSREAWSAMGRVNGILARMDQIAERRDRRG